MNVVSLNQAGPLTILSDTDTLGWGSDEDPGLGLEGSALSEHIRYLEDISAVDAGLLLSSESVGCSSHNNND